MEREEESNRNSRMLLLIVELEAMVEREEGPGASNLPACSGRTDETVRGKARTKEKS